MGKRSILLVALIILTFMLSGCKASQKNNGIIDNNKKPRKTDPIQEEDVDITKKQIEEMTLDEKLGQMVLVGFSGYSLDDNIKKMIEEHHVGGIILFKRNIKDEDQLLNLINTLKDFNGINKIPLFISVDEEGGRITRMPQGLKKLPTSRTIGKVDNGDFSFMIGKILARQLSTFGFNMNFAPVLDINSNPKNQVIGDRAFGSDVDIVNKLGIQTMKGIQSGGVISVVKHFPGHGDTSVDSHVGLPFVDNDIERLKSFELIPFMEAIRNDADSIMIAHILLTEIDPENPASISKTIITDILRKELDFQGVIITDDMTMGAISNSYDIGEASIKSVIAGTDIIMVAHGYENELAVIGALKEATRVGIISEERINDSVYRILNLKEKYKINSDLINSVEIDSINNEIEYLLNEYLK